ncbi:MAG: long-chain-fatty-acid--CoA ligase [Planctomycetaceae bacterium]|nr:long-chain-fatty-acid--CoA ligase [Planctomycetaceae bacterium]
MQNDPVNLVQVLQHAARFHGEVEIVSRQVEDDEIHRYTYAESLVRTGKLANALLRLGMGFGDRVATMAWNTYRHLEAWYAISGQGAICHTVNPRLFGEQIQYIINHAEDKIVLVDLSFVSLLEELQDELPTVEHFIVMTNENHMPETTLRNAVAYETLIADESDAVQWPSFPEETPSSLCYTSGTTGNPKGVLYTHRSNLLHAYAVNAKDVFGVGCSDSVLMVVPMFHANSWGLAYSCPMVGARMVLPGAKMDGANIYQLLDQQQVTFSAAVPTVWSMLLAHLEEKRLQLPYLDEVMIGGSAVPRRIVEAFGRDYGVNVVHGWGMTELSPIGTACRLKPFMESFSDEQQVDVRLKQGTPLFGVAMKIVDDEGQELPRDGTTFGRLLVKGPWIVQRYYRDEVDAVDAEGWFDTGDVATIDEYGYMQITDRSKDLIKSGGEWISSVDLENAAMGHVDVALAAVIGIHHPKWEERPLLVVVKAAGAVITTEDVLTFLQDKVAKWWLPDDVVFVDEIPLTATGKISKLRLRKQFTDYQLPGSTDS